MSEFHEKVKRQMTGGPVHGADDENRPKRRQETRPASQQERRPMAGIMAAIMGADQNRAHSAADGAHARSDSATSAPAAPSRQHKLKQRFTVIRKLGKGTYGKVQLAVNKETGQEVAIKTIKKTKIENEQDLERVRREIQIMSSIEHPHIVHIYEVFENRDKIVLIMQYAPGGELYEYLSQSKVLDELEARRLFRQIATAIFYCHQNKICHRDLKLENILLDEKNNAKIADFGLSNVFDKSRQLATFCGSPLYASPEIVQSSPYEGPEVDCWSLGVILYTLVYGAMPFDGRNFKLLVRQISEAAYYEPKQRSSASALIGRLLCADPLRRATILDVCSDPWVNGAQPAAAGPHSPRLAAQHPSLLKVAQDMANLTPVRLDILLSLTPQAERPAEPHPHRLADSDRRQIIQPAREHRQPDKTPPPDQQQQQQQQQPQQPQPQQDDSELQEERRRQELERAALMSQLGPELMSTDEARPTSPVASYVVREHGQADAHDTSGERQKPTIEEEIAQLEAVAGEGAPGGELADTQPADEKMQLDSEPECRPAEGAEVAAEDAKEANEEEPAEVAPPTVDQQPAQPEAELEVAPALCPEAAVASNDDEEPQAEAKLEPAPEPEPAQAQAQAQEPGATDKTSEQEEEEEEKKKKASQERAMSVDAEAAVSQGESADRAQECKSDAADTKGEVQEEAKPTETQKPDERAETGQGQEKVAGEEKPKKVKRRVVVVKKRRKVAKKDENEEPTGTEQPATGTKPGEQSERTGTTKRVVSKPSASQGPGKVRIPETFAAPDPDAQAAAAAAAAAAATTTARQSRRPSALITDVSQKLMQQHGQGASSSAIEQDQPQLASVRVSDKRSEFERRSSQAAQSPVATSRDGPTVQGALAEQADPPTETPAPSSPASCEVKREPVRLPGAVELAGRVESVARQEPLGFGQLLRVAAADSEPLTPTNTRAPMAGADETARRLSECAERLSGAARKEGERSDSVETIRGEGESEDAKEEGDREEARTHAGARTIRSSLQINLAPAQERVAPSPPTTSASSASDSMTPASSLGPAPITRSYKKVTFTKDGTCITETGRIYSTKADDGTMRRVERKSKVTHYPGDDAASPRSARAQTTTTHEEVVYESTDGGAGGGGVAPPDPVDGFWPRASSRAPLERLIMPSSSFFGQEAADPNGSWRLDELSQHEAQAGDSLDFASRVAPPPMARTESASSCSSGSTDVFDDIFDTWTGAISMFGHQHRHPAGVRGSLMSRAFGPGSPLPFGRQHSSLSRGRHHRPQSSTGANAEFFPRHQQQHQQRDHHQRQPWPHMQQPGSASIRQRCESVEPDVFAHTAGLGSARGRFGSSNLFSGPPAQHADPFWQAAGPEPASLFEQMELEHERLRRRFAQQRKQMWKGSTPLLNEIPEFRPDATPRHDPFAGFSDAGSHWSSGSASSLQRRHRQQQQQPQQQQQQQQQQIKRTSLVFQMGGGGGSNSSSGSLGQLRQSRPLDAAPVRRNTANLTGEFAPPSARTSVSHSGQLVQRSSSRTSLITTQLANIQLSEANGRQQNRSASFLGLKRNSSASSQAPGAQAADSARPSFGPHGPPPGSAVSSATATFWADEPATPTTTASSQTAGADRPLARAQGPGHGAEQSAEANSRIQSWLLQSAGDLSVSSGSKSSASDATLPSSGRSDTAYLASSAGQMAPLRRDESLQTATTSTTSSIEHSMQQQRLQQQQQHSHHHYQSARTTQSTLLLGQPSHQLPPAPSRSPGGRPRDKSPMFQQAARPPGASLIVRSSSRKSVSERPDGRLECHEVTRADQLTETIVSNEEARQRVQATCSSSTTTTSTSAVVSQKMFAFPGDGPPDDLRQIQQQQRQQQQQQQQQRHHHQQVIERREEMVTSSRQELFSQRAFSPLVVGAGAEGPAETWLGQQRETTMGASRTTFASGDDEFDSLVDLESICSSSLLEQLRARGYRSMINQRMGPGDVLLEQQQQQQEPPQQPQQPQPPQPQQQQQQQPQAQHPTTPAPDTRPNQQQARNVVTSSASITLSSASDARGQDHVQTPSEQQALGPARERASDGDQEAGRADLEGAPSGVGAPSSVSQDGQPAAARVAPGPAREETDQEMDEDVREAKANIRDHLERMRETEKFLKSMHEEEERVQRQRQELLLFDNLLLSAKLNGIKPSPGLTLASTYNTTISSGGGTSNNNHYNHNAHLGSLDCDLSFGSSSLARPLRGGPHSAPVGGPHSNGFLNGAGPVESSASLTAARAGQVSCFSSDLFKPTASAQTTGLMGSVRAAPGVDPLEPVQPISVHAYAPPVRTWHRSKSQLGDQFSGAGDYRARRPLSANMGAASAAAGSPGAYFPSRQRRSMSQVRYSHYHQSPSAFAHDSTGRSGALNGLGADDDDDDADSSAFVSEYRSSFGPNLEASSRASRSPRRATSPLEGPRGARASGRANRRVNGNSHNNAKNDGADDDDDDDALGLSSYRASSYVPRTASNFGAGGALARPSGLARRAKDDVEDERVLSNLAAVRQRRGSVQVLPGRRRRWLDGGGGAQELDLDSPGESSPTRRRRSWASAHDTAGGAAGRLGQEQGLSSSSRLSELEQRLQANKKRREELLMGINSAAAGATSAHAPRETRRTSGANSDSATHAAAAAAAATAAAAAEDDDEDLDQSFGFERPSRPAARASAGAGVDEPSAASLRVPRLRPSRLESMEARIKRRSYCIKLSSPDRTARTRVPGGGNKCPAERADVEQRE